MTVTDLTAEEILSLALLVEKKLEALRYGRESGLLTPEGAEARLAHWRSIHDKLRRAR